MTAFQRHHLSNVSFKNAFFLCALLSCAAFPTYAQTAATAGEKLVGAGSCNRGASAADFDTLAQCTSLDQTNGVFQKAPLFAGAATSPPYANTSCDASKQGMIQYTNEIGFVGCHDNQWISLSSAVASGLYSSACVNAQTGGYLYCCRMKKSDGSTVCKYTPNQSTAWTTTPNPFNATSAGSYSLILMGGTSGINFESVCRSNDYTGALVCVEGNSWTGPTAWKAFGQAPF